MAAIACKVLRLVVMQTSPSTRDGRDLGTYTLALNSRYCHLYPHSKVVTFCLEIVLLGVRKGLRYRFIYRDLEEILAELGMEVDRSKICRWAWHYTPELAESCLLRLLLTDESWRLTRHNQGRRSLKQPL